MKKFLTTFAVLTAVATPAFAQYAPQDYQTAAPPSVQHKSAARRTASTPSPWFRAPRRVPAWTIRPSRAAAAPATIR